MMRSLFGLTLCALSACGGRVEAPPDGSGSSSSESESDPTPVAAAGKSNGGSPDDPSRGKLGDCKPGFARSDSSHTCDWLTPEGLCYASKEAACNCTCPRDHDSVCVSGFYDGPGRETKVICN